MNSKRKQDNSLGPFNIQRQSRWGMKKYSGKERNQNESSLVTAQGKEESLGGQHGIQKEMRAQID